MHNYESTHGHLPPAVVYGENDRPLHSWRVLILPFIEQQDLYDQFKLDEPWDSQHNIQLLSKMPSAFEAPGSKRSKLPAYHTIHHVFVGKGAAFEGKQGLKLAELNDGLSNTILIVEAGEPVPWTKPEEISFDPNQPVPELRCLFKDGFRVAMGDGAVFWVKKNPNAEKLRAAITRNGNEPNSRIEDW
jgi:hypothetical protein